MSGRHAIQPEPKKQPELSATDARDRAYDKYLVKKVNDPDDWMEPLRDRAWRDDRDEEIERQLISTFVNRHIVPMLKKIPSLRGRRSRNE